MQKDRLKLLTNLSPFIPLPFVRGEGREFGKEASPLLIPLLNNLYIGRLRGVPTPLIKTLPLSLIRRGGTRG
jgi:hypothetical protein